MAWIYDQTALFVKSDLDQHRTEQSFIVSTNYIAVHRSLQKTTKHTCNNGIINLEETEIKTDF